jgi:hypothetical protein
MAVRNVVLLGLTGVVVDEAQQQLSAADVRLFAGSGIDDLRSVFAQAPVDHVIMGAGLDLDARLEIVREIFRVSDRTTVHMKDHASGKEAFLPFVRAVLHGLAEYAP